MKSYLNIKGKNLWKLCALLVLGIVISACYNIISIVQPTSAKVGDVITIKLHDSIGTNINTPNFIIANYVLGILMPKGWNGNDPNNVSISYTSTLGNGTMQLMPSTTPEPLSVRKGTNLNYSASFLKKFGIGKNLINDVEWVIFQSKDQYRINNSSVYIADAVVKIKVGADGNDTYYFPAYVTCETTDGIDGYIDDTHPDPGTPDYGAYLNTGCLLVTGGTTGILNDFCNPQLTTVDPPKSIGSEFITLSYNGALDTAHILKGVNRYLCVDNAVTTTGELKDFCIKTPKSKLVQTTGSSNLYKLTIWPNSYFGLTGDAHVTKMTYYITDDAGNRVGYADDPNKPFLFTYVCP